MTSPVKEIRELYERFPQPRTFEEDVAAHFVTGYLIATPEAFIMGRAIRKDANPALIADPWHSFDNPDTWLVWAAAGASVKTFLTFMPYPLTWIAWARRDRPLKFYQLSKLCAHLARS